MRMSRKWVEAIVVYGTNFAETDRIVGLLSAQYGKVSAFARSARRSQRRFGGCLDLFTYVRALLIPPKDVNKGLWRVTEMDLINPHFALRSDIKRVALATYLSECLWALSGEADPAPRLFDWWKKTLDKLENADTDFLEDIQLDLELLAICGYSPQWQCCVECGGGSQASRVYFSFERGGIMCDRCQTLGPGAWCDSSAIAYLSGQDVLDPMGKCVLRRMMGSFVSYILGKEPKSQRFREETFSEECRSVLSAS